MQRIEGRNRNENVTARPDGLREIAETALSCRRPGPARKKKEVYTVNSREEEEEIDARTARRGKKSNREQNPHSRRM